MQWRKPGSGKDGLLPKSSTMLGPAAETLCLPQLMGPDTHPCHPGAAERGLLWHGGSFLQYQLWFSPCWEGGTRMQRAASCSQHQVLWAPSFSRVRGGQQLSRYHLHTELPSVWDGRFLWVPGAQQPLPARFTDVSPAALQTFTSWPPQREGDEAKYLCLFC